ncbi:uncharacterized protein [Oscarella lobularis]|uniref:uncharacterized protein isoform X2 n=1 Tax=Oscarella lobularis TaxID=121494 RepID=UPI00331431CF
MASQPSDPSELQQILDSMRSHLPFQLYRLVLKSFRLMAKRTLEERSSPAINTKFILLASSLEYDEVFALLHGVGFQNVEWKENCLTMTDPINRMGDLINLYELLDKDLSSSCSPSVDQLRQMGDNVGLLVAHLSYNYHLRLELYALTFSPEMFPVVTEDIYASIDCIEYLFGRLRIVGRSGETRRLWVQIKQLCEKRLSSSKPNTHIRELNELFIDASRRIATELALRVSYPLVNIFLFLHLVRQSVDVFASGNSMTPENMEGYVNSFYGVPPKSFTPRFTTSVEDVGAIFFDMVASPLSRSRRERLMDLLVWQAFHFMEHYRADGVRPEDAVGELPFVGTGDPLNMAEEILNDGEVSFEPTSTEVDESDDDDDDDDGDEEKEDISEKEKEDLPKEVSGPDVISCSVDELRDLLKSTHSRDDAGKILESVIGLRNMRIERATELKGEIEILISSMADNVPPFLIETLESSIADKRKELDSLERMIAQLDSLRMESQKIFGRLDALSTVDIQSHLKRILEYQTQSHENLFCMRQSAAGIWNPL